MAPNLGPNRARSFELHNDYVTQEFDPEEDHVSIDDEGGSALDSAEEEHDAREHYVNVGKSKFRKPKEVLLGPQYRGSKISRNDMQEDEINDDPFGQDFEDEASEDEDSYEDGEEEMSDLSAGPGSENDEQETSDTDISDAELHKPTSALIRPGESVKEQLRKGLSGEAQRIATASVSQAHRQDAEKGRAVKRQRSVFDSLLSTRMKLQKTLIASNTLVGITDEQLSANRDDLAHIYEAAESAAFNLWNSLNTLREDLAAVRSGQKRKRIHFTMKTPESSILRHIQEQETESRPTRDAVLLKWSNKAQGPTVLPDRSRLNQSESRATVVDVLTEQLSNTERLVKRTRAPRSCAPVQLARKTVEDEDIYDDADFYSLLLKELLEQKSNDSITASNVDLGFQMRREAKTKRSVDTKASKGRKLRYTVHEKLQSFMAPEDRSSWGQRQADDLFGSLFGQRLGLDENEFANGEGFGDLDNESDVDIEEAGLMMFRN